MGLYNLEPNLTDFDCLHAKSRPVAEPKSFCGVSTSASASTEPSALASAKASQEEGSAHAVLPKPSTLKDKPQFKVFEVAGVLLKRL